MLEASKEGTFLLPRTEEEEKVVPLWPNKCFLGERLHLSSALNPLIPRRARKGKKVTPFVELLLLLG
jgi:hypothetical protein